MTTERTVNKETTKKKKKTNDDAFVAMVSAKAQVTLPLSDFEPHSMLITTAHEVPRPRFPAIDYHNHLDSLEPGTALRIMDECGIERIVNITMKVGAAALEVLDKFSSASDRFSTIGWMDWSGIDRPGFFQKAADDLERLVEHGAVGFKIWKDLGLTVRDTGGNLVRVDDDRLDPLFDKARELDVPIMFHTADPLAFFEPIDRFNERYEELAAHPEWSFHGAQFSRHELIAQRNAVFARHPRTRFVGAHMGECPEDLASVSAMLEACPNVSIDISARIAELGRQPYSARNFFLRHADRILFGTDLLPAVGMYSLHYRFLETADEYFEYPSHASRQGRWMVYGIFLPDDVLQKIYRENALRLLRGR